MATINEAFITYKRKQGKKIKVTCSGSAYNALKPFFEDVIDYKEAFKIILVDRANQIIAINHISDGGLSGTVVDSRLIAQAAILSNASGVILAHNHPSGFLRPSEEDKKVTKKIKEALSLFDIHVLDHVILGSENYLSFADEGIL